MASRNDELNAATRRYAEAFSLYTYTASIRFEHRAGAVLNAEGVRAGAMYRDTGNESLALAEVEPAIYLDYETRLWISIVPAAANTAAELLPGKAAEDVFVRAALRWLRLHAGDRVADMTQTSRDEIGNQIRIGVAKGETRGQIAERIVKHRRSVSPGRAQTIARTEVHAAANYGSLAAAVEEPTPLEK